MTQWIWQQADWPLFKWDDSKLTLLLGQARHAQGRLMGMVQLFDSKAQLKINIQALEEELITSSAIEGEILGRDSVRSSIAKRLGLSYTGLPAKPDRYIDGVLDMMLDATEQHHQPLDLQRLFGWQAALFPTGYSGMTKIPVGELRGAGEMQIVSGRIDKQTIHYGAPPRDMLPNQIKQFINWFNKDKNNDGIIRAAIAHLWFELLHPFEDGNGRVGRAIVEMALAQDEKLTVRYYSLSSQILVQRKHYYAILQKISAGSLDVTDWLTWFLSCYTAAIEHSIEAITIIIQKNKFWQAHRHDELNKRQQKVINRLLDAGPGEFEGGMTTRKYTSLAKTSRATAYREINDLVNKGCLQALPGKGRSSAYDICWPDS